MPFYDYGCECGEVVEVMCSVSEVEEHKETCAKCGKEMKRKLNAVPFTFSGEPSRNYKPLAKSNPKSHVRSAHELRRAS